MSHQEWSDLTALGCIAAMDRDYEAAVDCWAKADALASRYSDWGDVRLNPYLCLLRFTAGKAAGTVGAPIPTEDQAISMHFSNHIAESNSPRGMERIHATPTRECFRIYDYDPGPLTLNIAKELPHLMVMSTGRCGTISLARLLNKGQYLTYHNCLLNSSVSLQTQMMAQMLSGNHESTTPEECWAATRAAEWIGAINEDRPLALVCHRDTIWAPTFAKIHPLSKFIYLHRDPVKVFESFYTKNQWNDQQLHPFYYTFPFQWHIDKMDLPATLAWYIKFTENYCRAFGETMGDRFYEISADQLFEMDPFEVELLYEFAGLDLNFAEVQGHFDTPHNAKIHKRDDTNLEAGREAFLKAYDSL